MTFEPDPHVRTYRVRAVESDATERLIATLTQQAREGDEAVAAIARVRSLAMRALAPASTDGEVDMLHPVDVLRALDGTDCAST